MNDCLNNKQLHRVVTLLNREEVDFLDKLSKDALFSMGVKLSRTQILRALVEAAKTLNLETQDINSEEALIRKLREITERKTGGIR